MFQRTTAWKNHLRNQPSFVQESEIPRVYRVTTGRLDFRVDETVWRRIVQHFRRQRQWLLCWDCKDDWEHCYGLLVGPTWQIAASRQTEPPICITYDERYMGRCVLQTFPSRQMERWYTLRYNLPTLQWTFQFVECWMERCPELLAAEELAYAKAHDFADLVDLGRPDDLSRGLPTADDGLPWPSRAVPNHRCQRRHHYSGGGVDVPSHATVQVPDRTGPLIVVDLPNQMPTSRFKLEGPGEAFRLKRPWGGRLYLVHCTLTATLGNGKRRTWRAPALIRPPASLYRQLVRKVPDHKIALLERQQAFQQAFQRQALGLPPRPAQEPAALAASATAA